jgi:hypothetical protein
MSDIKTELSQKINNVCKGKERFLMRLTEGGKYLCAVKKINNFVAFI